MQSSFDRDKYIQIIGENINPTMKSNFNKYNAWHLSHFKVPYDYDSIMHYDSYAFSKNGKPTMVRIVSVRFTLSAYFIKILSISILNFGF